MSRPVDSGPGPGPGPDLDFDPGSASFARDPGAVYAALRAAPEPVHHRATDSWLLARYADVDAAARDPRLVRGLDGFLDERAIAERRRAADWHDMPEHERFVQTNLLESDGPAHRRLRMVVMREFTRPFVARHRAMIEDHVDGLLDALVERRDVDFVADFAAHVPGHVIGTLLGAPAADCPQLRIWSEQIVQFFDVDRSAEHKALAERATGEFRRYLDDLVAERRRRPREDLLSTLVAAQSAGTLDHRELVATAMLILMAGHGSTIDLLGTGLNALVEHPDEMLRLREDPGLAPRAVQEMIRFDTPLPFFHRHAAEPVAFAGRDFPVGARLGLLYASANRDPDAFPDPDRFDVGRTPNRHLSFGRGAHLCLGNHLSRLDAEVVFTRLLARCRVIERRVDAPSYRPGLSARGLLSLPVRLTPA